MANWDIIDNDSYYFILINFTVIIGYHNIIMNCIRYLIRKFQNHHFGNS